MLHFETQEFNSPDLENSGINMDAAFLQMLDDARGIAGIPFNITSGIPAIPRASSSICKKQHPY